MSSNKNSPPSEAPDAARPSIEIENKFRLDDAEVLRRKLAVLGAEFRSRENQCDEYFNHPARDFRSSDEALRVRQSNGELYLTYKGPRTDEGVKVREEIELPLAGNFSDSTPVRELLQRLGFPFVARVQKRRDVFVLPRGPFRLQVSLDCVEGLGWFAEIEVLATPQDVEQAKLVVQQVQRELSLSSPVRESYLRMVLAQTEGRCEHTGAKDRLA